MATRPWFRRSALVHPPLDGPATGGTRYNHAVLQVAGEAGAPLASIPWSGDVDPGPWPWPMDTTTVVWDSLYLPWLADPPHWPGEYRHGLLVHYLPHENPALCESARRLWLARVRRAAMRMGFLIATGQGIARRLADAFPGIPVYLAEPGVDPEFCVDHLAARVHSAGEPVRLITVANLLPAKRHLELLDLLAGIDIDWRWRVVGDAGLDRDCAAGLQRRVANLGLAHRVRFTGPLSVPELARALIASDIFVNYSAFESYGMALAEAAAVGLPIVTTEVGEAARLVDNGNSGRVVPVSRPGQFRRDLETLMHASQALHRGAMIRHRPYRDWGDTFVDFARALGVGMPWAGHPAAGSGPGA